MVAHVVTNFSALYKTLDVHCRKQSNSPLEAILSPLNPINNSHNFS
jgi:hypothetical protein